MNLTAIIVDDEARGRRALQQLVAENCPEVEVVALCHDVLSGVKAINQYQPNLVFLDIEMPNYSGFKLIEFFDEINFDIVFTTAYEQHAIRAFKTPAIGYLLKPINIDELIDVVHKVISKQGATQSLANKSNTAFSTPKEKPKRIVLNSSGGILYLQLEEIISLEADGRNTKIQLKDGQQVLSSNSLKDCQQMLENTLFQKIHRSIIINLAYVKKYSRGRDAYVIMENNQRLDVGLNFKDELTLVTSLFEK
ncbi:MAG TPA: response regulator transcription factor [Saprospiraceae bacterium]|nr:response regulator transcription factor [Saprospiraceae bacterium]